CFFFFSSRRRHTRSKRDWSSDVCSSDLHKLPNHRVDGIYRLLPQQSELIFYKAYPHAFLSYSWHTVFCGEPVLNHPEHLEVHVRQSHSSHNRGRTYESHH